MAYLGVFMKIILSLLLVVSFIALAQEDCPITDSKPTVAKFDFNLMGCFNFYVMDLGADATNAKCKILSKKQDFSDKNFSKCIDIYQPSRSEWKADITDKCIDLSKKHNFLSASFDSCVQAFSITHSGRTEKEKKLMRESGATKCLDLASKVDFTSKSFIRCFNFYGGNYWPLGKKEAQESLEFAEICSQQVQQFDFSTEKMYQCWDDHRRNYTDRKQMVENCMKEAN